MADTQSDSSVPADRSLSLTNVTTGLIVRQ